MIKRNPDGTFKGSNPWVKKPHPMLGKKHSIEAKQKISEANKGKKGNRKGTLCSDETKQKISLANKGRVSNRKGVKHSEETIQKLRKSHLGQIPWNKGKKLPQFSGKNSSMYGKHHSEETMRNMSNARTRANLSTETLKKMSESYLGKKGFWKGEKRPDMVEWRKNIIIPLIDSKPERIMQIALSLEGTISKAQIIQNDRQIIS